MNKIEMKNLDHWHKKLINDSVDVRKYAYAKYSNFQVGASLLMNEGEERSIVSGCNVENVSYGLTICAERSAVVRAVSMGVNMKTLVAVAVAAEATDGVVTPCGACRQFLAEFKPDLLVYLYNTKTGELYGTNMNYLLPGSFTL